MSYRERGFIVLPYREPIQVSGVYYHPPADAVAEDAKIEKPATENTAPVPPQPLPTQQEP